MSDLVGSPDCWFTHVKAHFLICLYESIVMLLLKQLINGEFHHFLWPSIMQSVDSKLYFLAKCLLEKKKKYPTVES